MLSAIFENLLIMILTVVFLLGAGYIFLVILGWGLRLKSKGREQDGLTDLWIESQKEASSEDKANQKTETQG